MADDAVIRLGYDNSKVRAGAKETQGIMQGAAAGVSAAFSGLGKVAAFGVAGVGLSGMVKRGMSFNKTMGDSEIAIANVLAQFKGIDAVAAKGEAAAAMKQIIELEPKAAGSLQDLTGGFLATVSTAQSLGISVEDNIDLVGRFANALGNANIPAEQLAQEMRSILTGNIGADSTLAKVLNISNKDVARAQAAGNLVEFLRNKIGKLGEAGDTASVAFSSLQSAIDKALGAATKGIFDQTVSGAKSIAETINEAEGSFISLGNNAGIAMSGIVEALKLAEIPVSNFVTGLSKAGELMGAIAGSAAAMAGGASIEEANKFANDTLKQNEADKMKFESLEADPRFAKKGGALGAGGIGGIGGIGGDDDGKKKDFSDIEFMNSFRARRDSLRWQEKSKQAESMTMNSSFDGKRRAIKGYTGGAKSGERLGGGGGWTGTSFNEFFNPEETQFGQKSGKQMSDQTFDEFFNPRGKKSAVKNTSTTNTRIRDGQIPQSDKILQDIRDGINLLASY